MDEVTFSRVAPVIAVRDLNRALRRYRLLGFVTRAYEGPAGTATSSAMASSSISASHRSMSVTSVSRSTSTSPTPTGSIPLGRPRG